MADDSDAQEIAQMDEPRKIGCATHAGTHGKREERSELKVEHKRPGVVITLYRQVGIGDPLQIMMSMEEATQLMTGIASAIESESWARHEEHHAEKKLTSQEGQ